MTNSTSNKSAPLWLTVPLTGYVIGAVPWGIFELAMWAQPGGLYGLGDVLVFTLIWPLRFLMWFFLT